MAVPLHKRARRGLRSLLLRGVIRVVAALPLWLVMALGTLVGSLAWRVARDTRRKVLASLAVAFPERPLAEREAIGRGSLRHLAWLAGEVVAPAGYADRIREYVSFHGDAESRLTEVMGRGRGVIYVTGHVGNWELMAGAVAGTFPVSVVAAPIEPEPVNDMIIGLRARMGVKTILRNRPGAAKELIRIFRENRILGILIDQDTDVEGAFVDFMGRPAWTPTAAAQMAIKFGAPVLFGYIQRNDNDRHTITIEGPLDLTRSGNDEEDIRTNTAMFTKKIEEVIRRNPEQWVWMHRRWRRQP